MLVPYACWCELLYAIRNRVAVMLTSQVPSRLHAFRDNVDYDYEQSHALRICTVRVNLTCLSSYAHRTLGMVVFRLHRFSPGSSQSSGYR